MKTVTKAQTSSTITLYVETTNSKKFLLLLRTIEELDNGRALTDDDIELRKEVSSYWSPKPGCVQVTVSLSTFNTLYNNKKR